MQNIVGEFINLRLLSEQDAGITFEWRKGDRASLLNKGAETVEQQKKWISLRPEGELNYMIETKENKPIGMISLIAIDKANKRAESARFLIGEKEASRGIPAAVEAMKLLYELAFHELGLVRIYGTIASSNKQMIKWQKYLGMQQEGALRNHYFLNGGYQDAICMGILKEEYEQVALPKMKTLMKMGQVKK
ncbi:MAG: GNAT family N-acetyltransferase [Halobacteriovoraceae bacterium]|jgi:RimJ/RimL family protein N-acetyltransferase|nr:GNAT family N-acetyltransferase [Halobacteriovoraceae bacterium]